MQYFFLVPGFSEKFRTGGLMVIRDVAEIIKECTGASVHFVTTHEEAPGALSLKEGFTKAAADSASFIVTWGPLVKEHINLIQKHIQRPRILYYAQSFGWNISVPRSVPIISVSRYVMAQWALHAPEHYVTYVPPYLHPEFSLTNTGARDIDILVHLRKQNDYCTGTLLPALRREGFAVHTLGSWISQGQFAKLLNRTKMFLYITKLHKASLWRKLPGEGFGLPALEAIACGALVGSNLLGGVTDFLTPGENCIKLENGDLEFDITQIRKAIQNFHVNEECARSIAKCYSRERVKQRWSKILSDLT